MKPCSVSGQLWSSQDLTELQNREVTIDREDTQEAERRSGISNFFDTVLLAKRELLWQLLMVG
jgi:hypothetical protein